MTRLILIRHGETVWNKIGKYQGQSDIELSQLGREQAQKLAERFPYKDVTAVYASSLQRATDTGKAVADKLGLEVVSCPELMEINFGDWEGLTFAEINATWKDLHQGMLDRPDIVRCPHGEDFTQVQERVVQKLQELLEKHKGETFAIAAHGGVNRTILCHALGLPVRYMWHMRQDNTAINVISYFDDGRIVVDLMNCTSHLQG